MKKNLILFFLILNVAGFSQASKNNLQKILYSDLQDENLKGPVKFYHLTAKYIDLKNKYNNENRIATPKGKYYENVFVEYNKYGLKTKSLMGLFNDSLELEPKGLEDLDVYKYSEYDLIYKNKRTSKQDYPSMLSQQFYRIPANTSVYRESAVELRGAVHEIYGMNYDEDNRYITDRVLYRTVNKGKKLEDDENEDLYDKNLKSKWHFEYSSSGLLKKISVGGEYKLQDIIVTYNYERKPVKAEIVFDYDKKDRLLKYTVFTIVEKVKEEIGFVKYDYNSKDGFAESESIFQKYPEEYYLSDVHNYTRKYNKQGDLIANLLHVEPKDEELVRKTQLYLDKYYEYKYDEHDNWIECKIRVNDPSSEVSAIMERKIEYFTD